MLNSFTYSRVASEVPGLRLSDLVVELGLVFDDLAIKDLEQRMASQFYFEKYKIPQDFFRIPHNKETTQLLRQLERSKFSEESKLTPTDITNIVEISKFFKT